MEVERKVGGKLHPKLNVNLRPIANKYHEGKVQRTLKREWKEPEIAEWEANSIRLVWRGCSDVECYLYGVSVLLRMVSFRIMMCPSLRVSSRVRRQSSADTNSLLRWRQCMWKRLQL